MRKITYFAFSVIFASLMIFTMGSCRDRECEHEWNEGEIVLEATCTDEGTLKYTCNLCEETKIESISAKGHSQSTNYKYNENGHYLYCTICELGFDVVKHVMVDDGVQTEPTATETGLMKIKCSVCGYTATRILDVTDHVAGEDYVYDEESHWKACVSHEGCSVILDNNNHTWEETEKDAATCLETGSASYKCSECNATKTVELEALGHSFNGEYINTDSEGHYHKCDNCEVLDTKVEHVMADDGVKEEATNDQDGIMNTKCSVCGYVSTRVIPALGHVQGTTYGGDDTHHWYKCTTHENCNEQFAKEEHNLVEIERVDAECEQAGSITYKCSVCQKEVITNLPALEHKYSEEYVTTDEDGHYHVCSLCEGKDEVIPHEYKLDKILEQPTLYKDGSSIDLCECGKTNGETEVLKAQSDFAQNFNFETSNGLWKYGSVDYRWNDGVESFEFTPLTEKTSENDGWVGDGIEIKAGWINVNKMLGIAYVIEQDILVHLSVMFNGSVDLTTLSIRVGIKDANGVLYSNPSFEKLELNKNTYLNCYNLKAGDIIYFIFGNELWENPNAYPSGALNIILTKSSLKETYEYDDTHHWKKCNTCSDCLNKYLLGEHEWNKESEIPAECGKTGSETYKCSVCDATKEVEIQALEHKYSEEYVTTDETGHYHVCVYCEEKDQVDAHTWSESERVPAQCGKAGSVTYICNVCTGIKVENLSALEHQYGEEFISTDLVGHYHKCTVCGTKDEVLEHSWVESERVPAQCGKAGSVTYACDVCTGTKVEELSALEHEYSEEYIITDPTGHYYLCSKCNDKKDFESHTMVDNGVKEEATAESDGIMNTKCSVCDYESTRVIPASNHASSGEYGYDKDTHWFTCNVHENCTTKLEEQSHTWVETDRVEPTCTTEGSIEYKCNVCQGTKEEPINALNHNFTGEYINTNAEGHYRKCSRCEATEAIAVHTWVETSRQNPDCENKGNIKYECTVCHREKTEAVESLGHKYSTNYFKDDILGHYHKCTVCGAKDEVLEHTWIVESTLPDECEKAGSTTYKCQVCQGSKVEQGTALDHDFTGEYINTNAEGHYRECSRCEATETIIPHTWIETSRQNSDCENDGSVDYECEICQGIKTEVLESPGHDFTGEYVNNDETGHYHKCSRCEKTDTPVSHEFTVWHVTTKETLYANGLKTKNCICGFEGTETEVIPASANYTKEFNLESASDGSWKYGAVNYLWDQNDFEFTPLTNKTSGNDGWISDGIEIKAGWINAGAMMAIAYTVIEDIQINAKLTFVGGVESTKLSLRVGIKNSEGIIYGEPSFFGTDNRNLNVDFDRELKSGDTIYFILNNEAWDVEGAYPNGSLSLELNKVNQLANFEKDFSLENFDGSWKYGTVQYNWDQNTFEFTTLTNKNSGNDGWIADGVEVKSNWINFGAMMAIAYTFEEDVKVNSVLNFVGGVDSTRLSIRIGVKNSEGTLYENPSFNSSDTNILNINYERNFKAGDTIYFIFANEGKVDGAYPNGSISLKLYNI